MEIVGAPIMTVACYCQSCQEAARRLGRISEGSPIADPDGGTHFVMHRKDRIACVQGDHLLREHRLTPSSTTRRVVAECCRSPMFLEFQGGHWLSIYKARFEQHEQPAIEMRTMTQDRRPDVAFSDNLPSPNSHSFRFMRKLMQAWIAMGFRIPKIDYVKGSVDA